MAEAYSDLCASMIADLEAQLPIARPGQKAELRRAIARWKKQAKAPVKLDPSPERKSRITPGHWRLGL